MFNADNIQIILDHFLPEELRHLEETISTDVNSDVGFSSYTLEAQIHFCEKFGYTDHIAYNLLLLKNEIQHNLS